MKIQELPKIIEERNKKLRVYEDYYNAEGRQWLLKGQITRSGQYLVDRLDISSSSANFFTDIDTQNWAYANDGIQQSLADTTRKRRYAEANIIDFAIDEASRLVQGVGDSKFEVKDSKTMTDKFNKYMDQASWDYEIGKLSKYLEIYGFIPVFVGYDRPVFDDPYNFYFTGNEKNGNLEAYEIKNISLGDASDFFLINFNIDIQIKSRDTLAQFSVYYGILKVEYYLNGKLIVEEEHNTGYSPVQRIKLDSGSSISKMISYQDAINIILTETSEVFKANLNPVTHISDNDTKDAARQYAKKNYTNMPIERSPGSVMITGNDGNIQYITWDGLPSGTLETLKKYEEHFYNRRGISLFSENNGVAESGKAKDEQKDQLRNIAQEIRSAIELGIKHIFNTWLAFQGFTEEEVKILWSDMTETTLQEKTEIELKHYAVHGDKETYLRRVGVFTEEEIQKILKNHETLELTLSDVES